MRMVDLINQLIIASVGNYTSKMKFLMLNLIIVLLHQQNNVNCTLTGMLSDIFQNWVSTFKSAIQDIKYRIDSFLNTYTTKRVETPMKFLEATKNINTKKELRGHIPTPKLAELHGRKVESHDITTEDGYILTVHRIIPIEGNNESLKHYNQTVILHHGLLGSSSDWIIPGPMRSLPYILSDTGYDVWMANARGNYYSRTHINDNIKSIAFWNFTWQHMGEFDLVTMIDYIRTVKSNTNYTGKIDFIGHSMGATALLVLLSTLPNYNDYLRMGILLAPLAFMTDIQGPLKNMMKVPTDSSDYLLNVLGSREFMPSRSVPKIIAKKYCQGPIILCSNPEYFMTGGIRNVTYLEPNLLERILYQVPAGASAKTVLHYAQLAVTGGFHKFNNNEEEFNLKQVILPIALISSDSDWLSTVSDVSRLYASIANPIGHYSINDINFSHTDFLWSPKAKSVVFDKILQYLEIGLMKSNPTLNEL